MASFNMSLPTDVIKDIEKIDKNSDKIFGGMTKAGAEVVQNNVKANAPPELVNHVNTSVTYKTPSDDGINTKVYIRGYLPFTNGRAKFVRRANGRKYETTKGVPAPFIAQVYEYGTSNRTTDSGANRGKISKRPFFRKSFRPSQIKAAMLKKQKELSGGLLNE